MRRPSAHTFERAASGSPFQNGLVGTPFPSRVTWRIFPERTSGFWARRERGVALYQFDASPMLRKSVPSAAKARSPTECPCHSLGMQSAPVGSPLQLEPACAPRSTTSDDGKAVSPWAVTRVRRAVFPALGWAGSLS